MSKAMFSNCPTRSPGWIPSDPGSVSRTLHRLAWVTWTPFGCSGGAGREDHHGRVAVLLGSRWVGLGRDGVDRDDLAELRRVSSYSAGGEDDPDAGRADDVPQMDVVE